MRAQLLKGSITNKHKKKKNLPGKIIALSFSVAWIFFNKRFACTVENKLNKLLCFIFYKETMLKIRTIRQTTIIFNCHICI